MKQIIAILVFLLAVAAAVGLYITSPKTKKAIPKRPVPLVQTVEVRPGREEVFIEAFGTVIPAQRITLQSEVEGRIIDQNPELIPGGLIHAGDMIIQVDPADYILLVNEYRAEVDEAMFELELEEGKQVIAGREWELMEEEIKTSSSGKSLALREPHMRLVKAKMEKAKSRLAATELALKRTTIQSPFNALVLEEFIDNGQLVSKQTPLATLAGTDQFRVRVSVPVSVLHRISLPGGPGGPGAGARVSFQPISGPSVVRHGKVLKIGGELDPEGRMARVLIVIEDPLNLHPDAVEQEREGSILLGSYVKVELDAGHFDNVYTVPRHALREGDALWVKDSEERLQVRQAEVVWRRKDTVLARADLKQGDALIISRLQSPLPGIKVRGIEQRREGNTTP